MKKKLLIIIGMSIVVLIMFSFLYKADRLSSPGTKLDEDILKKDLRILFKKEMEILSIDFFLNGLHPNLTVENSDNRSSNGRIIALHGKLKGALNQSTQPINVRIAVRFWLYYEERTFPFSVDGISVGVTRAGIIDNLWKILFTRDEFNVLYKKYKDYPDVEDRIVEAWINEHDVEWWDE